MSARERGEVAAREGGKAAGWRALAAIDARTGDDEERCRMMREDAAHYGVIAAQLLVRGNAEDALEYAVTCTMLTSAADDLRAKVIAAAQRARA